MKKELIAVTQRIVRTNDIFETRDCLDQRWCSFLNKCNFDFIGIPNKVRNVDDYLSNFKIKGILLTGGGSIASLEKIQSIMNKSIKEDLYDDFLLRDLIEHKLINYSINENIPLLGICRGMQAINSYYGGSLVKIKNHVRTYHLLEKFESTLKNVYPSYVNSFHDYAITKNTISDYLIPTAYNDFVVEAFIHKDFKQYGIMWHPEREKILSKNDLKLFKTVFS